MERHDDHSITGELLEKAKRENEDAIRKNNLTPAEKAILNGQSLIYMFIEKDHAKVEKMYNGYQRWQAALNVASKLLIPVITSLIILFVTQAYYFWATIVPKIKALP